MPSVVDGGIPGVEVVGGVESGELRCLPGSWGPRGRNLMASLSLENDAGLMVSQRRAASDEAASSVLFPSQQGRQAVEVFRRKTGRADDE